MPSSSASTTATSLTFSEIGDQLGVTASRVCQLVRRAVDRLRDHMEEPRLAA